MAVLEGKGIFKYFGGLAAVQNVDFQVQEGEIFGLIGPNGAGKTTLFNMIAGALNPSAGTITFKGQALNGLRPSQVVARGIARTYQVVKPFQELSVMENVMVGAYYGRGGFRKKQAALKEAERLLELTNLSELAGVPASSLSVGNLKRLEIARALATRPDLVLFDEVCGGLNPAEMVNALELMKLIRSQGVTIFYIEHNMRAVMAVCDRIMVLNYGKKIAEGSPEEIAQNQLVIEAYLGTKVAIA